MHASVGRAVAQFALSGLAVLLLVAAVSVYLFLRFGRDESIRDARALTRLAGQGIVQPLLDRGVVAGDPTSLARLDAAVRTRVLRAPVVRVKIWSPGGTIIYSDERRLVGAHYGLRGDNAAILRRGGVAADVSDLSRPENRFERSQHKLLEVYMPLRVRGGGRVVYEEYLRYSSIAASSRRMWSRFAPALVAALVLLWVVQMPLAWSLARRLRERQREREALLQQAVEASDVERRRIAADLHDGLVQELAGLSFELAAEADRCTECSPTFARAAASARASVRQLRSLLLQIYPPTLHQAGLESALADLLAPASAHGLETTLRVDPLDLPPATEELIFRAAQEALRNVLTHAAATSVAVRVAGHGGRVELVVEDDGRGYDESEAGRRRGEGHLGLSLLSALADEAGGTFEIARANGRGTRVRLEVPA